MTAVQLEFSLKDETEFEIKLHYMQHAIDEMAISMGKVRRRLFAQMGELHKLCLSLQNENQQLKDVLKQLKNEEIEWVYGKDTKDGLLFSVLKD